MDINEIKNKSIKELHDLLGEKRGKLRELSFQVSEAQLKNVREIRKAKKEIAQILTLINKQS
jgi:ribosomal protein L29